MIGKLFALYLLGAVVTAVCIPTDLVEDGAVFGAALLFWPYTLAQLIRKAVLALGRGVANLPEALEKLRNDLE